VGRSKENARRKKKSGRAGAGSYPIKVGLRSQSHRFLAARRRLKCPPTSPGTRLHRVYPGCVRRTASHLTSSKLLTPAGTRRRRPGHRGGAPVTREQVAPVAHQKLPLHRRRRRRLGEHDILVEKVQSKGIERESTRVNTADDARACPSGRVRHLGLSEMVRIHLAIRRSRT